MHSLRSLTYGPNALAAVAWMPWSAANGMSHLGYKRAGRVCLVRLAAHNIYSVAALLPARPQALQWP